MLLRLPVVRPHGSFPVSSCDHARLCGDCFSAAYVARLEAEIRRLRGEPPVQRQDALKDQLRDLVSVADSLGCYDAADYLRRVSEDDPV